MFSDYSILPPGALNFLAPGGSKFCMKNFKKTIDKLPKSVYNNNCHSQYTLSEVHIMKANKTLRDSYVDMYSEVASLIRDSQTYKDLLYYAGMRDTGECGPA